MTPGNKKPRRMSKMGKMRILKTLAVMAVMLCLAAVPAMAQSELDQSQTVINHFWVEGPAKQTFTAQKTGTLDKVFVYVNCREPSCDSMGTQGFAIVEIGGTLSGPPWYPPGYVQVERQIDVSLGGAWYEVSFSAAPFV